jgi:hypothetical protein
MSLIKLFLARNTSKLGGFFPKLGAKYFRKSSNSRRISGQEDFNPRFPSANGDHSLTFLTVQEKRKAVFHGTIYSTEGHALLIASTNTLIANIGKPFTCYIHRVERLRAGR